MIIFNLFTFTYKNVHQGLKTGDNPASFIMYVPVFMYVIFLQFHGLSYLSVQIF